MAKRIIDLSTKEELKIFMSPLRQQMIRTMRLEGIPMTAKAIADKLGTSASSAQHHLRLLEKLNIVELDHVESINGITARYFKLSDATVSIGLAQNNELSGERAATIQSILLNTLNGFIRKTEWATQRNIQKSEMQKHGDFLSGVLHLSSEDAEELLRMISQFIEQHETKGKNTRPWEYAMILYNAGEMK